MFITVREAVRASDMDAPMMRGYSVDYETLKDWKPDTIILSPFKITWSRVCYKPLPCHDT